MFSFLVATKPDDLKLTLSVTMSLSDWVKLKSQFQITSDHPAWDFRDQIENMVSHAQNHFYPNS